MTAKIIAVIVIFNFLHMQQNNIEDLRHQDPEVRIAAATILGKKREMRAIPLLIEALKDTDPRVSSACYNALKEITGETIDQNYEQWKDWWDKTASKRFSTFELEMNKLKEELSNLKEEINKTFTKFREDLDLRSTHQALEARIKAVEIEIENKLKLWWEQEGLKKLPIFEADAKKIRDEVSSIRVEAADMKNEIKADITDVRDEINQVRTGIRDIQSEAEEKIRSTETVMALVAVVVCVVIVLCIIYFAGYIGSKIREWKELVRQADFYIKESKVVTERVDKILDELEQKKAEILGFFSKLKSESEEEISRYSDLLQQNSDHRLREELMELRQKAEKELSQTLEEIKGQMDHQIRKVGSEQKEKVQNELELEYSNFLQNVESQRLFLEALFQAQAGRHQDAINIYKNVLSIKPNNITAWINMGNLLRDTHQYEQALMSYKKALEMSSDDSKALYNIAAVYAKMKNKQNMLEFLEKAIQVDGEFKDEALNDPAFKEYWKDPEFKDVAEG